jgi:NAD+ kinase
VSRVALIVHHERDAAHTMARELSTWLRDEGHEVRMPIADAAALELDGGVDESELRQSDVAVSLGGDGTMLRAVDLVAPSEVPIIGVNVGQLGYLTEVEPSGAQAALKRFFAGDFRVEERMLLAVTVDAPSGAVAVASATALNEAVLEKTPVGHTVRLDVTIDGLFFTPYAADGLIVATATGSTAYSFSARGPIVAPTHRCMVLTPVSPHMLFDRALILEPDTEVRVMVSGDRPAALLVDGQRLGDLRPGDGIVCTAAPHPARLVTFSPRDFHLILKAKFGLSDR